MSAKTHAMLSTDALHSSKIDGVAADLPDDLQDATLRDLWSLAVEAVYYRLHLATDKFGTMPGTTRDVMSRAFPSRGVSAETVALALDELVAARLVQRWCEVGGKYDGEWLHLTRFDDHCSATYLKKRRRNTPIPPSERDSDPVPGTGVLASIPSHSGPVPVPRGEEVRGNHPTAGDIATAIAEATSPEALLGVIAEIDAKYRQMVSVSQQQAAVIDQLTGSARAEPSADVAAPGRAVGTPVDAAAEQSERVEAVEAALQHLPGRSEDTPGAVA